MGLPLFLAQALSIAFYIVGFTETIAGYFPVLSPAVAGVATLMGLALRAYVSADLALKSQFITLLAMSLLSLFLGDSPSGEVGAVGEASAAAFWPPSRSFSPRLVGIEAGLGMSGDVKDPTLMAVATGYAIYLAIPIFLSNVVTDSTLLLGDSLIITRVASWPQLVVIGILGASPSSATSSPLAAPRTLRALAQDVVLPRAFGRGFGKSNDPRLATVAFVIAVLGIFLGDLNAIASILSMFFLTSYAVLNVSAGLEALIGCPSWKPSFKASWWASILGFPACVAAMLMIDAGATFVALFVSALVYYAVKRHQLRARLEDVRYGVLILIARVTLLSLARRPPDAHSWNPNVLALAGSPSSRWYLIVIARALAGDSGLLTVAIVVPDSVYEQAHRVEAIRAAIEQHLEAHHVPALVKVATDADVTDWLIALVKSYGFGPLVRNTVLLGKAETPDDPIRHAELLATIQGNGRNLIVVHEGEELPVLRQARRLDVW